MCDYHSRTGWDIAVHQLGHDLGECWCEQVLLEEVWHRQRDTTDGVILGRQLQNHLDLLKKYERTN